MLNLFRKKCDYFQPPFHPPMKDAEPARIGLKGSLGERDDHLDFAGKSPDGEAGDVLDNDTGFLVGESIKISDGTTGKNYIFRKRSVGGHSPSVEPPDPS